MLIFDTRIKFIQYFLSILGSFYVFPISFLFFYENKNNDLGLISIGIIFIIIGIVQFSFTLKSFQIYTDSLVIKRPFFIINPKKVFLISEIIKITFRQSKSRIGGGNYLLVKTKNTEESFMLIYSSKTLNEFISKLNDVGIETEVEFKFK